MSFFEELKRRNVIRVAAAYAVVGWLIIQVAETIFPLFGFDDGPARIVVILLAIGFPLTLIFSWAYEFTPDGLKLERDMDSSGSRTRYTGRKMDRAIIVALAVALGYFSLDKFVLDSARDVALEEIVEERVRDEMLVESNNAPSIAVLPFKDLSPNGDQEYFGDGITVQLLSELTRLDGLRVAPRASTFSFKGSNESLGTIAEALNVAMVLEGSIRKDGNRIRITAELSNVANGEVLWSQSYDRELSDIFLIQDEIASEVAGQLGVRLGVGGVNAFKGAGTRSVEAYELFLRSRLNGSEETNRLLDRAIQLDPNYAAAWSLMGLNTLGAGWGKNSGENRENEDRAYELVQQAVELDPESAVSNALWGTMLQVKRDWIRADEAYLKAVSLLPDRRSFGQYANHLMRAGRSADARDMFDRSEAAEPLLGPRYLRVHVAIAQRRFADARELLARSDSWEQLKGVDLTIVLHEGDTKEIKELMAAAPPTDVSTIRLYEPVLRAFDSREAVLSTLRTAHADKKTLWPSKLHDIALLAAYFGDSELALQSMGEESRKGSPRMFVWWYPLMSEVRQMQGFKELMTDLNLVAYWRASEWADVCRPIGDDDFECS